jgi:hypothetical protein
MSESHKEEYNFLLDKFSKELEEVGATEALIQRLKSRLEQTPELVRCGIKGKLNYFVYKFDGYTIEAEATVELTVKYET